MTYDSDRKLPPFGRQLAAARLRGADVNCWIFACRDAWGRARRRITNIGPGSALVLPNDTDPAMLRWPVHGLDLLVLWPDGSSGDVEHLGHVLIQNGATLVSALGRDETLFFRPKERAA